MKLYKSQGDLLKRVIERWEADGTIDVSTADRLKGSYTVRSFEWKELAKYSFWIAIVCGVIAVVSVLADHLIMDLLERLFLSSYSSSSGVTVSRRGKPSLRAMRVAFCTLEWAMSYE